MRRGGKEEGRGGWAGAEEGASNGPSSKLGRMRGGAKQAKGERRKGAGRPVLGVGLKMKVIFFSKSNSFLIQNKFIHDPNMIQNTLFNSNINEPILGKFSKIILTTF